VPTNLHTALTKPSSSKQKTDTKFFYNQIVVKKQNKFACRKGKCDYEKVCIDNFNDRVINGDGGV
jgi:hypothetical protein